MADACILGFIVIGCTALAVVFLSIRDTIQHRSLQDQKTVEERIADIKNSASFMIKELQSILEQRTAEKPEVVDWIEPLIAYYRRLEALATADASPEEVQLLAGEALKHIRRFRLKGFHIVENASQLASLISERNAA